MKAILSALSFVIEDLERDSGFEDAPYYIAAVAMEFAVSSMDDANQASEAMISIDAGYASMILELADVFGG